MHLPPVVTPNDWQTVRDELLVEEKEATRALDALAAKRRRLPMVRIDKEYVFEGPDGPATLVDLFEGRRQLIAYHFMFGPGSERPCEGCSSFTDNIGNLAHLNARDTTMALVSRAPQSQIQPLRQRMGWSLPWYSSNESDFNSDFGVTTEDGDERFGLSVFLRDGDDVFRTYFTSSRGVDRLRLDFNLLDLTPLGRQEAWEDSPEGWPQTPPYQWWRLHDEYGDDN
ncbi:MAG: protein of unknown function thioredoxin family protein [Actinobacteria bacterium]|nr:protein of unknown function thioredoxin family protein [Actinomycetota bacterium]